ncbi:MAG: hypothetical protein UH080_09185 [Ruminococcus sp.]|nr:hypothetical protein [Ruminococcus sp.]
MNKKTDNRILKITLSSTIAAVSLVLMLITGIFPFGTFALPCIAGMMITSIVIECGYKWAFAVYAIVSVLALIIAGDKEAVVYFIMLFGYYPILKGVFEGRIKNTIVQYLLKYAVFNVAVISAFLISIFILSVPIEEFSIGDYFVPWLFLIAGNIFFIIYDKAITSVITLYIRRLRGKIIKKKF